MPTATTAPATPAAGAPTPVPAPTPVAVGYDAFRTVRTRNIFDPNRRPNRTETPSAPAPRQVSYTPRSGRSNSLSLTGTMVTDERSLAFFSGSRSEYSKVLTVGETVAGMNVKAITPTEVTLESGGVATVLNIGRYLSLDSTTSGAAGASGSSADLPPNEEPTAPTAEASAPASAPPSDKNELLRRMMERREKEMSK